jgi:hypothetical protein
MKIKLITKEQHEKILNIYKNHPSLIFQNNGYEYIDLNSLSNEDLKRIEELNNILKNHIVGFQKFNNFQTTIKKEVRLRFQYNYGAEDNTKSFIGVGYILLDELLNGFR